MKWKLVPIEPTNKMAEAFWDAPDTAEKVWGAMLAVAPQPEHDRMTKEEAQAMQDWKGMDNEKELASGQSLSNDGLERPRYDRRIGRFALSRLIVERDQETARAIMGRCIVLRCEMMYHMNALEYIAMSPDFDEIEQGMITPEYDVHISEGGSRIEFKRSNAKLTSGALDAPGTEK